MGFKEQLDKYTTEEHYRKCHENPTNSCALRKPNQSERYTVQDLVQKFNNTERKT